MEQQLLEQQKSPNTLAFQMALAFSFYVLILTFVMEKMGYAVDPANISIGFYLLSAVLNYGPFIFAICYVQVKHKLELDGFLSYGRAFSCGFRVASYAGLFIAFLFLLYYKILSPGSLDNIIEQVAAKTGNSEEFLEIMQKKYIYIMVFGAAIGYTFAGIVISLITAAIVKKNRDKHTQVY